MRSGFPATASHSSASTAVRQLSSAYSPPAIVPEAACTSTQFHVQVSPDDFPAYWNASQAIAGIQIALGANSPFLLGKELWQETRIPLFEQATDVYIFAQTERNARALEDKLSLPVGALDPTITEPPGRVCPKHHCLHWRQGEGLVST